MIASVVVLTVAFAGLFVRRARVGARVRALTGVRLRATERAATALARIPASRVILCSLGGAVAGGAAWMVAGAVGAVAVEPVVCARADAKRKRLMSEQLLDVARALGAGLRAGRNLAQALEAACEEAPEPVRGPLEATLKRLEVGVPMEEALDVFAARADVAAAELLVETLRVGREAGSDLPSILDLLADSLAERERLVRDRRAATSQARMSASVVGAMPVAFFVLAGSGARAQLAVLTGTPVGWGLLAAGLIMEGGGVLWMRALLRER